MNKAVFLDRDGIINIDGHYIHRIEEFQFVDGIFEFCRAAKEKGYLLIVFTNQSGIARGYYTEDDFLILTDWMCARFIEEEAPIDWVYYCPFHPEKGIGKYKAESIDRKPNPGMIFKARDAFDIDLAMSIVLGDKDTDMIAGRDACVGTLLQMPGEYSCTPEKDVHVIDTLFEGLQYLI